MKYEMPAVNEERRAELVNLLINRHAIMAPDVDTKRMEENMEIVLDIALAALTAEPEYNISDAEDVHLDVKKSAYDRCHPDYRWICYPCPPVPGLNAVELPESYDDGHGNLWLPKDSVISAIKKSGGEVKS